MNLGKNIPHLGMFLCKSIPMSVFFIIFAKKMDMIDISLIEAMHQQLKMVDTSFHRYMYGEIPDSARLVGLTGPRGVGKSTLVLQKIKESDRKSLYVDADNLYFANHSLVGLADAFVKDNGEFLAIDEIHKYKGWSRELKQIHDTHPSLRVVFTGSSVLDIKKGESDLSRRALMRHMQGLSFREYMQLYHDVEMPLLTLDDVLGHKIKSGEPQHPLPFFHQYLKDGYFPFSKEPGFEVRLNQIISQTVEVDIPQYAEMMASTARKLKQLLGIVAQCAPYKPSVEKLAQEVGVSKNTLPDYLVHLEKAGMISLLRDNTVGMRALGKVEKLFIDNTNLMYAMAGVSADIGNVRETFFQNQLRVKSKVMVSRKSDFQIGEYTFEIGGKGKGQRQIEGIPNAFVVKDGIEVGYGNIIPLWHFGLLY